MSYKQFKILIGVGIAFLISVPFILMSIKIVDPGHERVVVLWGSVKGQIGAGFHMVNPFSDTIDYSVQNKEYTFDDVRVTTQDQLPSQMDITLKFRFNPSMVTDMYVNTGTGEDMFNVHILPELRSRLREVGKSVHRSEDLGLVETQVRMQNEIMAGMQESLEPHGIIVTDILMRDIRLPRVIEEGIASKKQSAQEAERQKEKLERFKTEQEQLVATAQSQRDAELLNAERIEIAANAKAKAIEIEQNVLINSPQYIEVLRINALEAIGKSPSSKVIMDIPTNGMIPLFHVDGN